MTAPVVPALNPSEVARNFILEVKVAGTYQPLSLKNIDPTTDDANMEGENRYSDGGYSRSNKTGTGWNVSATVPVASLQGNALAYDPALTYLMQTIEGSLGTDAQVDMRFYEYNPSPNSPRIYARQGLAIAAIKLNFGDPTANREAALTFTGQGKLNKIAHPYPQTAQVPSINSVTPTALPTAGGTNVRILGSGFAGTIAVSGVKFLGTNATSWTVIDDTEIVATAPAHAAGSGLVTVTNAVGPSTNGPTVTYS